jgi:hypothetical protein
VLKKADGLSGRSSLLGPLVLFWGGLAALAHAHCPTLSGVPDGLLEDPRACKFDPSWVKCPEGATDTSACLTAEEVGVVNRLYDGPSDPEGRHFEISGYPMGSEEQWNLPSSATPSTGGPGGGDMSTGSIKYLLLPTVVSDDVVSSFEYTDEWFSRVAEMGALFNAANTNLRPFEKRGGKLLIWHGLADTSVPPAISIAYYQGVQKEPGERVTEWGVSPGQQSGAEVFGPSLRRPDP